MKSMLFVFLSVVLLTACSTKYGISNAKAYVRKAVAGTVRVDDNGRPRNSGVSEERLIFIETDTTKPLPEFTAAWIAQKPFAVRLTEINQPRLNLGKTASGEDVILSPKEGHKIWQLLLLPQPNVTITDPALQEKVQQNNMVLTGKWKEKEFSYIIQKEEQLETAFYQ